MVPTIEIFRGEPNVLPSLVSLLTAVGEDLRSKGNDQWAPGYPPSAGLEDQLHKGNVLCLEEGGELIGLVVLNGESDPNYHDLPWSADPEGFGNIHWLAVSPDRQGRGHGRRLVEACQELACQRGLRWVRLDTYVGNEGSNVLYRGMGYRHVGDTHLQGQGERLFRCYEKELYE